MKKRNGMFNYDKHKEASLREQMRIRLINVNNQFREKWVTVVTLHRNKKLEPLARFFYPPDWYRHFIGFTMKKIEGVIRVFIIIYSFVTFRWMVMVHNKIFLWGISKKITTPREGFRKLEIKVHGKVVEELELKV